MEGCHRDAIETSKHVHGRPCSRFSSPPDPTLKRIAVSFIERNTFGFEKYFIYVHAREQKGGREKVWKRMDEIYIYILDSERQRICSRHGYLLGGYIVYIQARSSPVGAHAISLPTLTVIIVINNKT